MKWLKAGSSSYVANWGRGALVVDEIDGSWVGKAYQTSEDYLDSDYCEITPPYALPEDAQRDIVERLINLYTDGLTALQEVTP